MERIACPCYMNAKEVCLTHGMYLCPNCALSHGCPTVDLQTFVKDVHLKQVQLLDLFKILGFDTKRNQINMTKVVLDRITVLKQHKESINEKIDAVIAVCEQKLKELADVQVQSGYEPTVLKLIDLKQDRKHIELDQELKKIDYLKAKNEEKDRIALFIGKLKDEPLTNELDEFFFTIERQLDRIKLILNPLAIKNWNEMEASTNHLHNKMTIAIYDELGFFPMPHPEDLKFKENNLEETIVINKHPWKKAGEYAPPSPRKQSVFRRESDNLIEDSTFSIKHISMTRSMYKGEAKTPKTYKKSGFANNEISISDSGSDAFESEKGEEDLSGGLLKLHNMNNVSINTNSFENSEDEFSDFLSDGEEDEEKNDNIHKEFMQSKCQFKRLLKNTMDDMEEENFFDVNEKVKVTEFIRRFGDAAENLTKKLLLNFNKL